MIALVFNRLLVPESNIATRSENLVISKLQELFYLVRIRSTVYILVYVNFKPYDANTHTHLYNLHLTNRFILEMRMMLNYSAEFLVQASQLRFFLERQGSLPAGSNM